MSILRAYLSNGLRLPYFSYKSKIHSSAFLRLSRSFVLIEMRARNYVPSVPLQKLDDKPWERDRGMAQYRSSRYATGTHVA